MPLPYTPPPAPPAPAIKHHRTCRVCRADLTEVLALGDLTLNGFPAESAQIGALVKIPHALAVCRTCTLVQLTVTTPPDWMFKQYWYRSGVNEAMQAELQEIVSHARRLVRLEPGDPVLDIGANDGTLLGNYPVELQLQRIAVEPATNLQALLFIAKHSSRLDLVVPDYFPTEALTAYTRRCKIITAIAMAYDLEDPLAFFRAAASLLHADGVLVVQFQDLVEQLRACAFDNIVAEHLEYYTLTSLVYIAEAVGLYPVDVIRTSINGGSLRVLLRRGHVPRSAWAMAVQDQLLYEELAGLDGRQLRKSLQPFETFRSRVGDRIQHLQETLRATQEQGYVIDAYGASTKGNTLLQVLGWGPEQIRQVAERSPEKVGRFTITGIPIVSEEAWREGPAPITLCPIWQFTDGVLRREREYLERGGRFLFPLPSVQLVGAGY